MPFDLEGIFAKNKVLLFMWRMSQNSNFDCPPPNMMFLASKLRNPGSCPHRRLNCPSLSTPSHAGNTVFGSGILLAVLFTLFKKSSATSYQIPDERMYWRAQNEHS